MCSAFAVGISGVAATPAVAALTRGAATTVQGTTRLLSADGVPNRSGTVAHRDQRVLVAGSRTYPLTGTAVPVNASVRISGRMGSDGLAVASAQTLGSAPGIPATGTTQVLLMLAQWTAPDQVTRAKAQQQMFSDTNAWFRNTSYNKLGQSGDVTPWMKIAGPADQKCFADSGSIMSQAKAGATARGYDLTRYTNFVVYFPRVTDPASDCSGYSGWGYIGAAGVWLNGYLDRRTTVHEQGHNYGLLHGHSYFCSGVISGSCSFSDYGDDYDAMGSSSYVGEFTAGEKATLGWMTGRAVRVTSGSRVTLAPLEATARTVQAAVLVATASRSYWLEYRRPIGNDSSLPQTATSGVLVHVRDQSISGDTGSTLLDMRPGQGESAATATLLPGTSWTSPEGYRLTAGKITAAGISVSVARV